jgi:hypothetical protein
MVEMTMSVVVRRTCRAHDLGNSQKAAALKYFHVHLQATQTDIFPAYSQRNGISAYTSIQHSIRCPIQATATESVNQYQRHSAETAVSLYWIKFFIWFTSTFLEHVDFIAFVGIVVPLKPLCSSPGTYINTEQYFLLSHFHRNTLSILKHPYGAVWTGWNSDCP